MRMLLCAMLIFSAWWIGIMTAVAYRKKPLFLLSLADSLTVLQSEVCARRIPLPQALLRCAEMPGLSVRFYQFLLAGMCLDESFALTWRNALNQLPELSEEELHALRALGEHIGQYDAQTQDAAFDVCVTALRRSAEQLQITSRTNARTAIGIAFACGLLLAIVCY